MCIRDRVSSATVKSHYQETTGGDNKAQRTQTDKSIAQVQGTHQVSVNKVVFDSLMADDRSVGLGASSASSGIGLELQSVSHMFSDKPATHHMNKPSQSFEFMNDVVDESYDMVMLFNDCMPPLNYAVCDNVQQVTDVQFDVRKFIADSNVSMHFVDLSVFDEW